MNLFSSFYRDRGTEEHSTLEPFLTHSLTNLLNRLTELSPDLIKRFVLDVLLAARTGGGKPEASLRKLRKRLTTDFQWRSQHSVPLEEGSMRPDICLYSNGTPLVALEAKVSAPLRQGQLEDYGKWLAREHREANPGAALVFLTLLSRQRGGTRS